VCTSKRTAAVLAALLALTVLPLYGQDGGGSEALDDPLEYIRDKAVSVSIITRVVGKDRVNVWKTQSERITVSGKSVNVTLNGDDLKVRAHIIPFVHEDGSILLVAKGEVWAGEEKSDDVEYYTTVRSLPVEPGESVIFFPVGLAVDSEEQIYTIELEIKVQPYDRG
jgi:hypothetical protein